MIIVIYDTWGNEDDQEVYATPVTYFDVDVLYGAWHGRLLWKNIRSGSGRLSSSEVKLRRRITMRQERRAD